MTLDQDQPSDVTRTINQTSNRMHTAMRRLRSVRFSHLHLYHLRHDLDRYTIRTMCLDWVEEEGEGGVARLLTKVRTRVLLPDSPLTKDSRIKARLIKNHLHEARHIKERLLVDQVIEVQAIEDRLPVDRSYETSGHELPELTLQHLKVQFPQLKPTMVMLGQGQLLPGKKTMMVRQS
jgi:hypothetical protein